MAKNDKILIDGMIDELCETSAARHENEQVKKIVYKNLSVSSWTNVK